MNERVLIIDDSPTVRYKLQRELRSRGFRVDAARSGDEADGLLGPEHPFDVIVIDLMMPGLLNGEKLIETLHKREERGELSPTPMVVYTGMDDPQAQLRNIEAGALAFFRKGQDFDFDVMAATIRQLARVKSQRLALEHDVRTDGLTGLYSRRYGRERLEEFVAQNRRHRLTLSVVLLDIDRFKAVNDSQGHAGGDEVLRHVAAELRRVSRETDLVIRWGGEEFLFVFPDSNLSQTASIVERFRAHIAAHPVALSVAPCTVQVTISGGIAELEARDSVDTLLARADEALYRAKELGRNRLIAAQSGQLIPVEAA